MRSIFRFVAKIACVSGMTGCTTVFDGTSRSFSPRTHCWNEGYVAHTRRVDIDRDGNTDFTQTTVAGPNRKKVMIFTCSEQTARTEKSTAFLIYDSNGRLLLALIDSTGNGTCDKMLFFDEQSEPVAGFERIDCGVLSALPGSEAQKYWPILE